MTSFTASIFKPRFIVIAITGVILLLTSLWFTRKLATGKSHGDVAQIKTRARVAGELTAQYLDAGSRVIIIAYPALNETLEEQAEAFKEGLLQDKVALIATEVIQPSSTPGEETFSLKDVLRIQQTHPEATAFISLIGAPTGDLYKPGSSIPLIVALNAEPMENAEQLFNLGILKMALIPNPAYTETPDASAANPDVSPYIVTTAANVRSVVQSW